MHRVICNKTGCVLSLSKIGIPIKGCGETPNSKTGRCSKHPKEAEEVDPSDELTCHKCRLQTDVATMLIRGDVYGHGCNKAFHCACVDPPLAELLSGESWFCTDCQRDPKHKTSYDAARVDKAVSLGRTRAETRQLLEQPDIYKVDKLVGTFTSAQVRGDSLLL